MISKLKKTKKKYKKLNNIYSIKNIKKNNCDILCDYKYNNKYSWNDYNYNMNNPNLTNYNNDKIDGNKIQNNCICNVNNKKNIISSNKKDIIKPNILFNKTKKNYWTGYKYNISNYKTKYKCIKNKKGNFKNINNDNYFKTCYNMLYLSLFIIYKILILSNKNNRLLKNIKETIELLDKLYEYDKSLLNNKKLNNININNLLLHYILLRKGLLVDKYNIYNRNCILHCGKCGKCSNIKDLDVIFKTKDNITQNMTKCSVKYASPLGHKNRDKLNKCLNNKNIDFTPMCSNMWYDDIDCASSFCKDKCILKFITFISHQFKNCILCDEHTCGYRFIHSGANRRSSGIISDINRNKKSFCKNGIYSKYFINLNNKELEPLFNKLFILIDKLYNKNNNINKFNKLIDRYILKIEKEILLKDNKIIKKVVDISKLYENELFNLKDKNNKIINNLKNNINNQF